MRKFNEYFNGNVKSIGFESTEGTATVGVMEIGEYEFSTSKIEIMSLITGELTVKLPDTEDWKVYKKGENFTVAANKKFQLKVIKPSSYLCLYK